MSSHCVNPNAEGSEELHAGERLDANMRMGPSAVIAERVKMVSIE